jgi:hypothetical protein
MISNTPGLHRQMQIYADVCSNCVFHCKYLFNLVKSEDICRLLQVYAGQRRHMQIYAVIVCFAATIYLTLLNLKIYVGFCRFMQASAGHIITHPNL